MDKVDQLNDMANNSMPYKPLKWEDWSSDGRTSASTQGTPTFDNHREMWTYCMAEVTKLLESKIRVQKKEVENAQNQLRHAEDCLRQAEQEFSAIADLDATEHSDNVLKQISELFANQVIRQRFKNLHRPKK